jgi:hypothetical protein
VTITVTAENGITTQDYKVTVNQGIQLGITIVGPVEENITVTHPNPAVLAYGSGGTLVFTVTGTYDSVAWYMDGSLR